MEYKHQKLSIDYSVGKRNANLIYTIFYLPAIQIGDWVWNDVFNDI